MSKFPFKLLFSCFFLSSTVLNVSSAGNPIGEIANFILNFGSAVGEGFGEYLRGKGQSIKDVTNSIAMANPILTGVKWAGEFIGGAYQLAGNNAEGGAKLISSNIASILNVAAYNSSLIFNVPVEFAQFVFSGMVVEECDSY